MRRRQEKMRRSMMQETREKIAREVTLPETITIQELSQRMAERSVDVIKYLMKEGQMMKPGDVIDADLAELIAGEFGHTVKRVSESDVEEGSSMPRTMRANQAAASGGHHHGSCRPRQDLAARRHPQRQCGIGRSRWHHPAHRRLSGREERSADHLHRYAGPRRLHRDACPRRPGDRYRHSGGGRR
jgi:hypothetical protein